MCKKIIRIIPMQHRIRHPGCDTAVAPRKCQKSFRSPRPTEIAQMHFAAAGVSEAHVRFLLITMHNLIHHCCIAFTWLIYWKESNESGRFLGAAPWWQSRPSHQVDYSWPIHPELLLVGDSNIPLQLQVCPFIATKRRGNVRIVDPVGETTLCSW